MPLCYGISLDTIPGQRSDGIRLDIGARERRLVVGYVGRVLHKHSGAMGILHSLDGDAGEGDGDLELGS